MKKLKKILTISMLSLVFFIAFGGKMRTEAADIETNAEALMITGYEVTNGTITPGNEFTLTIHLHNYSSSVTAPFGYVVVTNPAGVIPEYGTISETYFESVRPGADASVSFKYTAEATIDSTYLDFEVAFITANIGGTSNIRIPVGRTTDFNAENVSVPKSFGVEKSDYVSAKVTNLGITGVSNVVMVARCDGEEIASTRIGTMAAGTNKTQTLGVSFTKEGEFPFDLVLTYTNSDGENKEYVITSTTITVDKEIDTSTSLDDIVDNNSNSETNDSQTGISVNNVILICICGFLLIAVCCVVLILIYKRK